MALLALSPSCMPPPPPAPTRPDAARLQIRHTVVPAGIEMALLAIGVLPAIHFGGGSVVCNKDFADLESIKLEGCGWGGMR